MRNWRLDPGSTGYRGEAFQVLIAEEDVEQGLVHADAVVVLDVAELAEAVHEGADAGAGAADHAGQGLLRDGGEERLGLAGLAVLGEREQQAGEAFFGAVEELVDEIGLRAHAAFEKERGEEVGKSLLFAHDAEELLARDAKGGAGGDGHGCCDAGRWLGHHGPLAEEVARSDKSDGGFATGRGDHGDLGAALLEVVDGIGGISLGEEPAVFFEVVDGAARSRLVQERPNVKDGRLRE